MTHSILPPGCADMVPADDPYWSAKDTYMIKSGNDTIAYNECRYSEGCTKQFTNLERINSIRNTLRVTHQFLEAQGVQHTLFGGSAVGAYRCQDVLPWDVDSDVLVLNGSFPQLLDLLEGAPKNTGWQFEGRAVDLAWYGFPGFTLMEKFPGCMPLVVVDQSTGFFTDMFPMLPTLDHGILSPWWDGPMPCDTLGLFSGCMNGFCHNWTMGKILPPRKCKIHTAEVNCPHLLGEFLFEHFGPKIAKPNIPVRGGKYENNSEPEGLPDQVADEAEAVLDNRSTIKPMNASEVDAVEGRTVEEMSEDEFATAKENFAKKQRQLRKEAEQKQELEVKRLKAEKAKRLAAKKAKKLAAEKAKKLAAQKAKKLAAAKAKKLAAEKLAAEKAAAINRTRRVQREKLELKRMAAERERKEKRKRRRKHAHKRVEEIPMNDTKVPEVPEPQVKSATKDHHSRRKVSETRSNLTRHEKQKAEKRAADTMRKIEKIVARRKAAKKKAEERTADTMHKIEKIVAKKQAQQQKERRLVEQDDAQEVQQEVQQPMKQTKYPLEDQHEMCWDWALMGTCTEHAEFMKRNCPQSCAKLREEQATAIASPFTGQEQMPQQENPDTPDPKEQITQQEDATADENQEQEEEEDVWPRKGWWGALR
eukprot:gnl/TRDRNA2_/TRDRNA2_38429_c0_seq1.p1 gnl/TRDRNA2_/TRDRNA2_38429_c0~~gnl/TRDRNA2_/TRDRNA2_38429_c0_seq1.p1  ORF type:complete len:687 (+),score=197.55 gnl/TRDRNA2_/TRDRNA2_38429_c0_seq1:121-2061(+)